MQLNKDKFLIIRKFKFFIISLEKLFVTFPKKDYINRNLLYKECISTLELIYLANNIKDKTERYKIQAQILSKISIIDFYIEKAYSLKYISNKECIKKSEELSNITKMIYGWIKDG